MTFEEYWAAQFPDKESRSMRKHQEVVARDAWHAAKVDDALEERDAQLERLRLLLEEAGLRLRQIGTVRFSPFYWEDLLNRIDEELKKQEPTP